MKLPILTTYIILCVFGQAAAKKPAHDDVAAVARWQLYQAKWGVLATRSLHLKGVAFGNPISVVDAFNDGTPYFYVSMMDASMKDLSVDSRCTLTLTEASIDCQALGLMAEDPRCVRLSLSGVTANVTDKDEVAKARSSLYKRHPEMKDWPADHNWMVAKLQIENIWLIDYFGGASDVPLADYRSTKPHPELDPINATHVPFKQKPPHDQLVATARWLAHESYWGAIATTSIHLNGTAFGNTISVVDGLPDKSTGNPYFYVSGLDTTMQDLLRNPNCTLTLSEASVDCADKQLDPEDPRCVRLALSGTMPQVTDADELKFAKRALFTAFPDMASWPEDHHFQVRKLEIAQIWLINFFGGANEISPKDYLAFQGTPSTIIL